MLRFIVVCGLTILVSMTFLACQQEREETFPDNRPVVFAPLHSVWGGGAQSRAYDDTWDQDDKVGIYMLKDGSSPARVLPGGANVQYMIADENTPAGLAPVGKPIYYPLNDNPVNFVAYYPYRNDIVSGNYPVDVHCQYSLTAIDLMIGEATNEGVRTAYRLSDGTVVPLTFKHKLTKLVITATPGADTGIIMSDATLFISGMPTFALCNLYSGTFSGWSFVDKFNLVLKSSSDTEARWEAIIIPHLAAEFTGRTFTITAGDNEYIFELKNDEEHPGDDYDIDFEEGKVYTYTFVLTLTN
jgi:hypothetical protein